MLDHWPTLGLHQAAPAGNRAQRRRAAREARAAARQRARAEQAARTRAGRPVVLHSKPGPDLAAGRR